MRIVALYDIHANLPALEAVLADVEKVEPDLIVIGGDVIPGPMPAATLDRLLRLSTDTLFMYGNGERDVLTVLAGEEPLRVPEQYRPTVRWTAERISEDHRKAMAAWPLVQRVQSAVHGDLLFCHATPRGDNEIITKNTAAAVLDGLFEATDADIIICGHTHMQFDRTVGGGRVINAGSVGMPFGGNAACWLLLDDEAHLRQTSYDVAGGAARVEKTSYPDAGGFAERFILDPPTEREMLAVFDSVATRES
jgi:putative phosphoesterase